ncbi:hypothetical protein ACLKA6_013238 [Drosophila palustris]
MEDNRPQWGKGCSRGCILPQRVVVALFGFLALIWAYTNRVSMSHIITKLVVPINRTDEDKEAVCPKDEDADSESSDNKGEFEWSEQLQGIILGSFYVGYLITHLPGGVLADKYGAKWVLAVCMLVSGISTICTPLGVMWGKQWGLMVIRIIMGAAQGPLFPALTAFLSAWVPSKERATLGAFTYSGVTAGVVVSNSCSGLMLHSFHWRITLFVFGGLTLVWFIFFVLLCYSTPDQHPCIKPKEMAYLNEQLGQRNKGKLPIPWKDMLLSKAMMAVIVSQIGHDWGYFVMITCLPKYMSDVLQFSIRSNGFVTSLPFIAMWVCTIIAGWLADWLIRTEKMSINLARKLFTFISAALPGAFMVAASYAGCDKALVVALFTISMLTMGFYYSGQKLTPLDMSPAYSGTIMAITNGLGSLSGLLSPPIVGALTPNATLNEWRVVFWLGFVILVLSAIVFWIWGSAEVQPYDPAYSGEKKKG